MRIVALCFLLPFLVAAQPSQPSASEIRLKLKKLNFLGSVLYVAAHPDDENTRVIAHLTNDRLAATAYLSMTRGDGGQNLIGPEIRDLLGLIRTQELLSARRIDGGEQFFTRANDFGFSKNVNETMEIWGKKEILSDVVRIFRQYQPDVIITRFPPDERAGHGHHTASAVLAQEAFELAAKSDAYPEQVKQFGTWQVKRLLTNTGRWWNQTINENTPGVITLNVGGYNHLLGKSASEIAAQSRTQHKSQGFGSPGRRGDAPEYFELIKGEPAKGDIFENVNTTWTRLKGGEKIEPMVDKIVAAFDVEKPYASIPALLQLRKELSRLDVSVWRERKIKEINELVQACAGLYVEVASNQYYVAPGDALRLSFEIVNRSAASIGLKSVRSGLLGMDSAAGTRLENNKLMTFKSLKTLSTTASYSGPYWLKEEHAQGIFTITEPTLIGKPDSPPSVVVDVTFDVEGEEVVVRCPLVYKWTDPVKGELSRPFEIVPKVVVSLSSAVYVFKDTSPQHVSVNVKSLSDLPINAKVKLALPRGWKSEPAEGSTELPKRNAENSVTFLVTPSREELNASMSAVAIVDGKEYHQALQTINYDHIPTQTLFPESRAKLLRMDLVKNGSVIAYIRGAGDDVPTALRNMGYEVWEMKNEEVTAENLKKIDAVVLGIKALNTNERIRYFMPTLLNYVEQGGTLISQYNNNFDLEIEADKFSPYPITISRDRVTNETSEMRFLNPDHPLMNFPNKITPADFDGWVQERGLYYPGKWDAKFDALLSSNDPGEKPLDGGLLVAKHGAGYYVYTSLSFFRQLPEGVAGSYKLFANLVSQSRVKPPQQKVKPSGK